MGKPILITGATGTVGRSLVKLLCKTDANITILTRNREYAQFIFHDLALNIISGDIEKPDTYSSDLDLFEKVFLLTSPDKNQVNIQKKFIGECANKENIKHLVKLSILGADPKARTLLGKMHFEIEQEIKTSGIPYTILRPNLFMQNFLISASSIKLENILYSSASEGKISYVDARDIAFVALKCLMEDSHTGNIYELTGESAFSASQAAQIFSTVLGREITYSYVPVEIAEKEMVSKGVPMWLAIDLSTVNMMASEGYCSMKTDTVEKIMGKKPYTFFDYIEYYKSYYL